MTTEITIIVLLLAANGLLAMAELAIISARRSRLKRMSEQGQHKARLALSMAEDPTRFLSTVQLGMTVVGIVASVYSGDTLAGRIQPAFAAIPALAPHAHWIALTLVIVGLTLLTLILGELIPKRIALINPEVLACFVARPLQWLSRVLGPLVGALTWITERTLTVLGIKNAPDTPVSEEEVVDLMQEGLQAGVFDEAESDMVESVLSLDSLAVREIMTPRPKIVFIGKEEAHELVWHKIVVSGHSIFPVYDGNRDNIVGVVSVKAMYANLAAGQPARVRDLMVRPLVVPATQSAINLMETLRKARVSMALVADEFGSIVGLVTLSDLTQAVLGDFPTQHERLLPEAKQRDDGTWLVDGLYDIGDLSDLLGGVTFPPEAGHDYQTLAGFVMSQLSHVPAESEHFDFAGWRFEIIDMDRHRIDKLLLTRISPAEEKPAESTPHATGATAASAPA